MTLSCQKNWTVPFQNRQLLRRKCWCRATRKLYFTRCLKSLQKQGPILREKKIHKFLKTVRLGRQFRTREIWTFSKSWKVLICQHSRTIAANQPKYPPEMRTRKRVRRGCPGPCPSLGWPRSTQLSSYRLSLIKQGARIPPWSHSRSKWIQQIWITTEWPP